VAVCVERQADLTVAEGLHYDPRRILQGGADDLVGRVGQFSPASLAALASVGVEDCLAFDAEVSGPQADHLGPASPGQDERQQDGSVSPAGDGVRDHG